jgi:3-hydroxyacyl-CoA dehydrogenase
LGFNALPGFLNRKVWEISQPTPQPELPKLSGVSQLSQLLGPDFPIAFELVADRPGLVSARTVCMIINEANWMLDEAAADAKDIDTAMCLGVNYPKGPLEWQTQMGTRNVVEVLAALGRHYGTDTYKISPRLTATYALSTAF